MTRQLYLPDEGRSMGIMVVASRGAGKSRLLARLIGWLDFIRGIPLVVLDPNGALVDNMLDKITRLPPDLQQRVFPRLRYIDTAGVEGQVVPFPLYYRADRETLYAIAQRYLDVVSALDTSLSKAPILGANAVWRTGSNVGMVLAACNLQITEAEDLLQDSTRWQSSIREALQMYPELAPAVEFVNHLSELRRSKPQEYSFQVDSFLTKLIMFKLDPVMRATFGASSRGINWEEVVQRRLAVLIDFRNENDAQRMKFKLFWIFSDLIEYIRRRGPGRHRQLSIIFDEVTYILPSRETENDVMTAYMNELVNRLARNNQVWLTLALQELHSVSEQIQKTLMTMGTQIIGSTTNPRTALELAGRFFPYDAYLTKKTEPIYVMGMVADYRTVEFSKDEQRELNSHQFLRLPRYHFLVGVSKTEGTMPTSLTPVSIERIDRNQFVNAELVSKLRQILVKRSGRQVSNILAEIESRKRMESRSTPQVARTIRVVQTNG